ncbi:hypothetical protein EVAR_66254_1, partial [Eumeta japonica]
AGARLARSSSRAFTFGRRRPSARLTSAGRAPPPSAESTASSATSKQALLDNLVLSKIRFFKDTRRRRNAPCRRVPAPPLSALGVLCEKRAPGGPSGGRCHSTHAPAQPRRIMRRLLALAKEIDKWTIAGAREKRKRNTKKEPDSVVSYYAT